MAEIDLSNAVVSVAGSRNAIQYPYVFINNPRITNSNGTGIVTNEGFQVLAQYPKFVGVIYGEFTTSGTEFYITPRGTGNTDYAYRISNISFNSGDTFTFKLSAEIQT